MDWCFFTYYLVDGGVLFFSKYYEDGGGDGDEDDDDDDDDWVGKLNYTSQYCHHDEWGSVMDDWRDECDKNSGRKREEGGWKFINWRGQHSWILNRGVA